MDSANPPKVLLITSGQPALNPRLVKEADALAGAGYEVTVLYAYWNNWGTEIDKNLLPAKNWTAIRIGGDPEQKPVTFFLTRLIHKLAMLITNNTGIKYFADFAITRSSYFLIRAASKHKAALYIGHNLGALPATVKAAAKNKKPCGFDAEDFHRFEVSDDKRDSSVMLKSYIENKYIPQANYLTTSSPGISAAYQKLYTNLSPVTVLNVFPVDHRVQAPVLANSKTLKLFWFSQTVDSGRGLSDCILALCIVNNPAIELHLLGYVTDAVKRRLVADGAGKFSIVFHQPVSPDAIVTLASQFDIGLALEDSTPLNRDICLTNKIFTYLQAGLAVIASDTTAQKDLLATYPAIGRIYEKGNIKTLAFQIEDYNVRRDELYRAKKASYDLARADLNWEKESEKFLKVIKDTLPV